MWKAGANRPCASVSMSSSFPINWAYANPTRESISTRWTPSVSGRRRLFLWATVEATSIVEPALSGFVRYWSQGSLRHGGRRESSNGDLTPIGNLTTFLRLSTRWNGELQNELSATHRFSRNFVIVFVDFPKIETKEEGTTVKHARISVHNVRVQPPYIWDVENPEGYGNRIGRYRTDVESRFMFDNLGPSPLRILDMGGGSGRFGGALSEQGHHVTLIDKNPEAVALAEKRGVQRAIVCDISDFHEAEFDGVVCMEVIQYFEKCDTLFARAAESLKAGGTFIFCFTNSRSWRFRLRDLKGNNHKVHGFSIEEIERSLASHRFEITARKGFQWSLAQTGSDSRIVDASIWIERRLGLQHWLSQSPWLLYACRKSS